MITDMRMPGMDGAQLLEQVKKKSPQTVRIVLSGQSDRETIFRSVGPTHQYLAKPCDVDELKQKLAHAFALRELLADPRLKGSFAGSKPSPAFQRCMRPLPMPCSLPDASITEVGNIIAQDMGMCMKVLQLVNSAFFGLPGQISNPRQAAALIGIDNIKALVLSVHVFSQFENTCGQDLSFLWKHCVATAISAKAIARMQAALRRTVDESFTAGLLHDVGKLVLCSAYKEESAHIWKTGADATDPASQLSRQCWAAPTPPWELIFWVCGDYPTRLLKPSRGIISLPKRSPRNFPR